jgi:hypothetical protein
MGRLCLLEPLRDYMENPHGFFWPLPPGFRPPLHPRAEAARLSCSAGTSWRVETQGVEVKKTEYFWAFTVAQCVMT